MNHAATRFLFVYILMVAENESRWYDYNFSQTILVPVLESAICF